MVNQALKVKQGRKVKKLLFYCALVALPVLQFTIFYIYVNINSIILAFQSYDTFSGKYDFVGFANIGSVLKEIFTEPSMLQQIGNSLIAFAFTTLLGITLSILFSYYIYKNGKFSGIFKTVLFLPQIISALVLVIIFKYFVEMAIPEIWLHMTGNKIEGLFTNPDTMFGTVVFFTLWVGFGTQVLMYVAAMYGINEAIVEAARIDGVGFMGELWYITIPSIWPTISTFIVVGFANLFNNQLNLYSFGANTVPENIRTIGYHLYVNLLDNSTKMAAWPELAAKGLVFTIIIMPFVYGSKYLLNRFGPKED